MLQDESTLQIPGTVPPGRQAEVSRQQRTGSFESFDHVGGIHGRHQNRLVYILTMRTFLLIVLCMPTIAAAQSAPSSSQAANERRLTVNEAVQIALQNNLGVQVARIDPAIRDLAQARSDELRALLDYNRSIVDFETVQEAPLR